MRCHVLLFAQLREAIGQEKLIVELPGHSVVDDAFDHLARKYQAIAAMRPHLAVAVNESYCALSHQLSDGDTIALIPPVSGG